MALKDCGLLNLSSTVTKSVRKRKRLDFLTDLKLPNVRVQTSTTKDCKGLQRTANEYAEERRIYKDLISKNDK